MWLAWVVEVHYDATNERIGEGKIRQSKMNGRREDRIWRGVR
jgi:hypothetical protein